MNALTGVLRLLRIQKTSIIPTQYALQTKDYAIPGVVKKKGGKKGAAIVEKKLLPVETDTNKLVNYVCGTDILKESEPIKLKEDSEYPDWLWTLNTGPPIPIEELDPNTLQYWRRLRKMALRRKNKIGHKKV